MASLPKLRYAASVGKIGSKKLKCNMRVSNNTCTSAANQPAVLVACKEIGVFGQCSNAIIRTMTGAACSQNAGGQPKEGGMQNVSHSIVIVWASGSALMRISILSSAPRAARSVRLMKRSLSRASDALDTSSLRKTSRLLYRLFTIRSISLSTCTRTQPMYEDRVAHVIQKGGICDNSFRDNCISLAKPHCYIAANYAGDVIISVQAKGLQTRYDYV